MDEFEQRCRLLGWSNRDILSYPDVAQLLGVSAQTLWRWGRQVPQSFPAWQLAGGTRFLTRYSAIEWCRAFAAKHPELMERRKLPAVEQ